jgi:hypothetical protein
MTRFLSLTLLAVLVATVGSLNAQDAASPEARLRETLRATTLQLRTAQNDLSTAQTARDALTSEKTAVETELAKLQKQLVADRLDNDKTVAGQKAVVAAQAADLSATRAELEKTRASLAKVVDYARKTEIERNALTSRVAQLETQGEDQISRNIALYELSNEILNRYAKFGLGQAIVAREPFIGTTRVKLENQVQDYGDRIRAMRIKTAPVAPVETTAPAPASANP